MLKRLLIAMTAVAVVSDSMLLPFYPQFFAGRFGIDSPVHVGLYLATACLTVMLALPAWARLAKRIDPLVLLIYTQVAAGVLCVTCYTLRDVLTFWAVSMAMLVFKASYLLIYPYVMRLEHRDSHAGTIGVLSVVVHFGGILGALLGGVALDHGEARDIFLVMAVSDVIQVVVCLFLVMRGVHRPTADTAVEPPTSTTRASGHGIIRLGLVMLVFYFSAFLIRPFFVLHWEAVSGLVNASMSALVFAIPGAVALLALVWNAHARRQGGRPGERLATLLIMGTAGLLLQASPLAPVLLVGRVLFGWALFQVTVRLEVLIFETGTPDSYASDYSKAHIFQNLGVLGASFATGSTVSTFGLASPFLMAALGFVATALLFPLLLQPVLKPRQADISGSAAPYRARGLSQ
ncbi:MFS transporter [Halomonas sp. McH1-25]|uniref:MFS transporter n=1 Tax=unclassified Halomonas TaxID=2609666 RepID=UPI001EF51E14|nr:MULTISPECIES: MFS transporter [unclassified Halomonas]MCG7600579.1 MFS transporter [Halomonas sp. McH1-25]MCP1342046.1 MFS transporter [Halomonas sp. FL8]MCP1359898.1 MFS transporter [Halomonas sp. BBD45]MCP1365316.1 MFS transporter [Halomonas sp. BBD48]